VDLFACPLGSTFLRAGVTPKEAAPPKILWNFVSFSGGPRLLKGLLGFRLYFIRTRPERAPINGTLHSGAPNGFGFRWWDLFYPIFGVNLALQVVRPKEGSLICRFSWTRGLKAIFKYGGMPLGQPSFFYPLFLWASAGVWVPWRRQPQHKTKTGETFCS